MPLVKLHLTPEGSESGSCFISITTSLVQALTYASNMKDPGIAVIDMTHPALNMPSKMHHAKDLIAMLKGLGEWERPDYKGTTEHLVCGHIPPEAIIHYGSVSDLKSIGRPLQMTVFEPVTTFNDIGRAVSAPRLRVSTVVSQLRSRNLQLEDTVRCIGEWGRELGVGGTSLAQIQAFVASLIDGWYIAAPSDDKAEMARLALVFAAAVDPRPEYTVQDVMEAFVRGVRVGRENVGFYMRRQG